MHPPEVILFVWDLCYLHIYKEGSCTFSLYIFYDIISFFLFKDYVSKKCVCFLHTIFSNVSTITYSYLKNKAGKKEDSSTKIGQEDAHAKKKKELHS